MIGAKAAFLKYRAAQLRRHQSPAERKFFRAFRESYPHIKIRQQVVLYPYIVDFLLPAERLIIEIDGDTHDPKRDRIRDLINRLRGYRTIRFWNTDIHNNLEECLCLTSEII